MNSVGGQREDNSREKGAAVGKLSTEVSSSNGAKTTTTSGFPSVRALESPGRLEFRRKLSELRGAVNSKADRERPSRRSFNYDDSDNDNSHERPKEEMNGNEDDSDIKGAVGDADHLHGQDEAASGVGVKHNDGSARQSLGRYFTGYSSLHRPEAIEIPSTKLKSSTEMIGTRGTNRGPSSVLTPSGVEAAAAAELTASAAAASVLKSPTVANSRRIGDKNSSSTSSSISSSSSSSSSSPSNVLSPEASAEELERADRKSSSSNNSSSNPVRSAESNNSLRQHDTLHKSIAPFPNHQQQQHHAHHLRHVQSQHLQATSSRRINNGGSLSSGPTNLRPAVENHRKCFVGNLDWHATEANIVEFFSQFGRVSGAKIIRDRRTGLSKGYGFVTLENLEVAQRLILMGQSGALFMCGRQINVNASNPPKHTDGRQQHAGGMAMNNNLTNNINNNSGDMANLLRPGTGVYNTNVEGIMTGHSATREDLPLAPRVVGQLSPFSREFSVPFAGRSGNGKVEETMQMPNDSPDLQDGSNHEKGAILHTTYSRTGVQIQQEKVVPGLAKRTEVRKDGASRTSGHLSGERGGRTEHSRSSLGPRLSPLMSSPNSTPQQQELMDEPSAPFALQDEDRSLAGGRESSVVSSGSSTQTSANGNGKDVSAGVEESHSGTESREREERFRGSANERERGTIVGSNQRHSITNNAMTGPSSGLSEKSVLHHHQSNAPINMNDLSTTGPMVHNTSRSDEPNKIFVGGLDYGNARAAANILVAFFGPISSIRVVCDPHTNRCKGYGFILFQHAASATAALKKGFIYVDRKQLRLGYPFTKKRNMSSAANFHHGLSGKGMTPYGDDSVMSNTHGNYSTYNGGHVYLSGHQHPKISDSPMNMGGVVMVPRRDGQQAQYWVPQAGLPRHRRVPHHHHYQQQQQQLQQQHQQPEQPEQQLQLQLQLQQLQIQQQHQQHQQLVRLAQNPKQHPPIGSEHPQRGGPQIPFVENMGGVPPSQGSLHVTRRHSSPNVRETILSANDLDEGMRGRASAEPHIRVGTAGRIPGGASNGSWMMMMQPQQHLQQRHHLHSPQQSNQQHRQSHHPYQPLLQSSGRPGRIHSNGGDCQHQRPPRAVRRSPQQQQQQQQRQQQRKPFRTRARRAVQRQQRQHPKPQEPEPQNMRAGVSAPASNPPQPSSIPQPSPPNPNMNNHQSQAGPHGPMIASTRSGTGVLSLVHSSQHQESQRVRRVTMWDNMRSTSKSPVIVPTVTQVTSPLLAAPALLVDDGALLLSGESGSGGDSDLKDSSDESTRVQDDGERKSRSRTTSRRGSYASSLSSLCSNPNSVVDVPEALERLSPSSLFPRETSANLGSDGSDGIPN